MATTETTKSQAATEAEKPKAATRTTTVRRTERKARAKVKDAAKAAATVAGTAKRKAARTAAAAEKAASGTAGAQERISAGGRTKARGTGGQPLRDDVAASLGDALQTALGQVRRSVDGLIGRAQALQSGDLPKDARALVRRHPMAAGIGAMAVGFALARALRPSTPVPSAPRARAGAGSWFGR